MNVVFTDEQLALREAVRGFVEQVSPESAVRRLMESDRGYDEQVWKQMADQIGLQGLAIDEAYGGAGGSLADLAIVVEEMGRRLFCSPYFASSVLAANLLMLCGDEATKRRHLPGLATGELIATVALADQSGDWGSGGVDAELTEPGGWSLTGSKSFVLDAAVAGLILVAAGTSAGLCLFAVPADAAGVTVVALPTFDQTRRLGRVDLDAAPGTLVCDTAGASAAVAQLLDIAAVVLGAEQIGGAASVLEMAVDYAKNRVQFGRPIGSFQAIKHRCADMFVDLEAARSAVYYAAACPDENPEELPVAAAIAKSFCSPAFFRAAAANIQIHGGIGFTWEHPAHLYFKRAKSDELLFGTPVRWQERLAERIGL